MGKDICRNLLRLHLHFRYTPELYGNCKKFFVKEFSIFDVIQKKYRSTSKIVEWEKKKRAKRIKNVLQCPMC